MYITQHKYSIFLKLQVECKEDMCDLEIVQTKKKLQQLLGLQLKEYEEQQKKLLSGQTISPDESVYPLKLVLMSATLRVEDFTSGRNFFHDPPPVMEVPTHQYPVTIHFSKRSEMVDYVGQEYKKILSIHKRLPPGGILVFVTGQGEVEFLSQKLPKSSKEIVDRASKDDNKLSLVSEGNTIREKVDKEISEAFDVEKSSLNEITPPFYLPAPLQTLSWLLAYALVPMMRIMMNLMNMT